MQRKITGAIGFIIFIWTFGAIFDGADDPIFGKGVVQLALIGIISLIPYIVIVMIENKQIQVGQDEVKKLIKEKKFQEAEEWLRQKGARVDGDVVEGNLVYLSILSMVYEQMGKSDIAVIILQKLAKSQPDSEEYSERLKKLKIRIANSKDRVLLSNLHDLSSLIGNKCFHKDAGNYLGTIIAIDAKTKICKVKSDFNKEFEKPIGEVLVTISS